jgi:1-acyl-sn-glycerol-3-phosphate acyltransferase
MTSNLVVLKILSWWIQRHLQCVVMKPFPKPPFIVAANHTSYFDHFVMSWLIISQGLPSPKFLTKQELFESPLSSMFNRTHGGIPINRGTLDPESFEHAGRVLDEGGILVIYPEGTRSKDGKLGFPRAGISYLASHYQVPIVPIGFMGMQYILPIGKKVPRMVRKAFVHMGNTIEPPGLSRSEQKAFSIEVLRQIAVLTGQWSPILGQVTEEQIITWNRNSQFNQQAIEHNHDLVKAIANNEQAFHVPPDQAIPLFTNTLQLLRKQDIRGDSRMNIELGRAYAKLADYSKNIPQKIRYVLLSKKHMNTGLRLDPTQAIGWHAWGTLMERLPKFLGGDSQLGLLGHRMAASLNPDWIRGGLALARAHYQREEWGESLHWAQRVLLMNPVIARDNLRIVEAQQLIEQINKLKLVKHD